MRYLSVNKDGSIATWATVPLKVVSAKGEEFAISGVRRRKGQCIIYGDGFEIAVGDEDFDVSDMPSNHIGGFTIVFPDFELDILSKLPKEMQEQYANHRIIKREDLVTDRTFRGAWIDEGSKIGVHMEKAKEIHKNNLRAFRALALQDLDREYMKADEVNDSYKKKEIAAQKQKLRDITDHPRIASAKTPEELKSLTLEELTNK